MIPLDSSHPFDWPGSAENTRRLVDQLLSQLGVLPLENRDQYLGPLSEEVARFGRQLPVSAQVLFERPLRSVGQRHGIAFVDVEEAIALRRSLREVDGLARLLGEAFLPIFYVGEGVTASVHLPKQSEPCADSFVVLVEQVPAGFEFGAFSIANFLGNLAAIVSCVRNGYPERLGRGVPPLLREWLL